MRTHDEFLAEARRIEAVGALFAEEHRRAAGVAQNLPPRIIPTFLSASISPHERWVEAEMLDGALEYRLVGRSDPSDRPHTLFASDSAYDLLVEADELEQKEKLSEALAPIIERVERREFDAPAETTVVEEVETLIEISELDPAMRLRTKADIVEFLGGQLEPSVFISSVVERRAHCQEVREDLSVRAADRRMIEQL